MRPQGAIDRIDEIKSVVSFDEAAHSYSVKGRVVPSVTTVLPRKGFFVTPERLEECRDEGKWNHRLLEAYFLDEVPAPTPFNDAITGFISRHPEFGAFVGAEVVLWSKFGYAGTADLLFEHAVVDMKRTIGDKRIHALQTAGYHRAAVEHGLIADNRNHYIIRLDEAGVLEQKNVWNSLADMIFLACVQKYKAEQSGDADKAAKLESTIQQYLKAA